MPRSADSWSLSVRQTNCNRPRVRVLRRQNECLTRPLIPPYVLLLSPFPHAVSQQLWFRPKRIEVRLLPVDRICRKRLLQRALNHQTSNGEMVYPFGLALLALISNAENMICLTSFSFYSNISSVGAPFARKGWRKSLIRYRTFRN